MREISKQTKIAQNIATLIENKDNKPKKVKHKDEVTTKVRPTGGPRALPPSIHKDYSDTL